MTKQEYLSPDKFPLTTQADLTLDEQMTIDAFNHYQMEESREHKKPFSPEDEARFLELKAKVAAFPHFKKPVA